MATVTINGTELATDDPKAVRKALAKALKDEKAKQDREQKDRDQSLMMAQARAYDVLSRKVMGESFPHPWRFFAPGTRYAPHLFHDAPGHLEWRTVVKARTTFTLNNYRNEFLGAVSDGAGWAMLIFLRDVDDGETKCYAVAAVNESYSLAHVPGVTMSDFQAEADSEAA